MGPTHGGALRLLRAVRIYEGVMLLILIMLLHWRPRRCLHGNRAFTPCWIGDVAERIIHSSALPPAATADAACSTVGRGHPIVKWVSKIPPVHYLPVDPLDQERQSIGGSKQNSFDESVDRKKLKDTFSLLV